MTVINNLQKAINLWFYISYNLIKSDKESLDFFLNFLLLLLSHLDYYTSIRPKTLTYLNGNWHIKKIKFPSGNHTCSTAPSSKWCVLSQTACRGNWLGLSVILGPTRVWHQFVASGWWDRGTYDAVVLFTSCKIMLNRESYMWNRQNPGHYFRRVRKWMASQPPHEESSPLNEMA